MIDERRRNRRVGRLMLAVASVGLLVSVVGTAVAWTAVGRLEGTGGESLDVSLQTLDSVEDTIDLADRLLTSTDDSLAAVENTLMTLSDSFATSTSVLLDVATLAENAEPALGNATVTLDQLADVGSTIDTVLSTLSRVPLGPDYDPDQGFGETVDQLSADLDPLAASLGEVGEGLRSATPDLEALQDDLVRLSAEARTIRTELSGSDDLLAQYRENVAAARSLAEGTRNDIDTDLGWFRLLVVVAGVNFAFAQIVPFWEGRRLLRLADQRE